MKYTRKTIEITKIFPIIWALVILLLFVLCLWGSLAIKQYLQKQNELIKPINDNEIVVMERIIVKKVYLETLDGWVDEAAEEFTRTPTQKSILKAKLHFLLSKESKHGASDGCGDNGLACGPMQFHEATWVAYRKQMIKEGYAEEIGDRHNMKQAIFTTAWAISEGKELAWGPLKRGEIKL